MSLSSPGAATQEIVWPRKTRAEELRLQLADEIVRGERAVAASAMGEHILLVREEYQHYSATV